MCATLAAPGHEIVRLAGVKAGRIELSSGAPSANDVVIYVNHKPVACASHQVERSLDNKIIDFDPDSRHFIARSRSVPSP